MSFDVAAETYDRFMGRFSVQLAPQMADLADVRQGQSVIDVGSGPGALTTELVKRLGAEAVFAVEPSAPFVDVARRRHPGVDVRQASAESLPFADGCFDAALAQLVVHFMADPLAGLGEMRRVTRDGGTVVACVWDHAGGRSPVSTFWRAAVELDPGVHTEDDFNGARAGHLAELFHAAGLVAVEDGEMASSVTYTAFEEWWHPYTLGVGPAGQHFRRLDDAGQRALRARCAELLGSAPFTIDGVAWAARGRVSG